MPAQPRPPEGHAPRILLTRPAAQGMRFARDLLARLPGAEILHSPLLAPAFLSPPQPAAMPDAVIFTSETGVEAARRLGWPLPDRAWCVGDRTAAVATAAGFRARSAGGDAAALVGLLLAGPRSGRLLHLRGADSRGEVAATLAAAGIPTDEAIIYEQRAQPLLPAARAWLDQTRKVIVPLFSPRTAQLFAAEASRARAPLHIAALSDAVAAAAPPAARVSVAARPDAAAMSDLIDSLTVN
ncbi:MAG: uroporphyrinogen-III synthase [Paracoccaceae bacterium]|nr:MAG: uroporphyrinogen-III synthase [Paracoccaceae bacterium]